MKNTKILFAGIGGVGGYFGGTLAHHYENNENVEVSFMARGEHLKEIKNRGLKVIKGRNQFIAKPKICTDNCDDVGIVDFIIICTKTYDLETISKRLLPCIKENTVLITLLNGPNNQQLIQGIYPNNLILNGCVYLVSRLKKPGVIENSGNIQTLYFGKDNYENQRLYHLEKLLKDAKIKANYNRNISQIVWEKFIFLSPIATATTSLNKTIGELLENNEYLDLISALIEEVNEIAKAKEIYLPNDITEKTIAKLRSLPFKTTTSMHSDFHNNKPKTELEALTTFVIKEGKRYGIRTPNYILALELIKNNTQTSS